MKASITQVGVDAAPALAELFEEGMPGSFDLETLSSQLQAPGVSAWVLGHEEGVLAAILVRRVLDEAEVLMLASRARRCGHGSRLLEHARRWLEAHGVRRIFLEVAEDNTAARGLYAKAGFRAVGRRRGYYRSGADALLLEHSAD